MMAPCLVTLAALAPRSPAAAQATTGNSFQWTGRIPTGAVLRVFTVDGDIKVTPASGDQAEVHGERCDDRPGYRALAFKMVQDGANITVCAYDPEYDSCGVDGVSGESHRDHWERTARAFFDVRLPAGVRVVTRSGDGNIDIRGAQGGAEVSAASGDGEIRIEGATGQVTASTGDGPVTIATSVGPVNASSGDGPIEVRVGAMPHPQDMRIHTGDGSITLYIPATFGGELEAHTGDGRIESDFPLQVSGRMDSNHIRATLGSGGPTRIDLSTGDGDVYLRQSR